MGIAYNETENDENVVGKGSATVGVGTTPTIGFITQESQMSNKFIKTIAKFQSIEKNSKFRIQ